MNDITIVPSKSACFIVALIINCVIIWLAYNKVGYPMLMVIIFVMMILPIIYSSANKVIIQGNMARVQTPASTFTMKSVEAMELFGWSLVITGNGGKKHVMHCVKDIERIRGYIENFFGNT